ncbi:MAG: hypothetical protein WBA63_08575 [Thermomicrobiales bacterium]
MSFVSRFDNSPVSPFINRRRFGGMALGAVAALGVGMTGVVAQSSTPDASPAASPEASPVAVDAASLLPDPESAAQGLDTFEDAENDSAAVVASHKDAFTEAELDRWGWKSSITRTFSAPDPAALPEDATTGETVTIDSFADASGAASAFMAYADAFASQEFQLLDAAALYGDQAHLLWKKDADSGASEAALIIQKESMVIVITTEAPNGSPIFDAERTAVAMGLRTS